MKTKLAGESFPMALLAYRATPHETTTVSPAHLLMGHRLRTTLPTLPSHLQPDVVRRNIVQLKDQKQKAHQLTYYNQRYGARPLPPLQEGDRLLIWDIPHRDWRVPAIVMTVVNQRSFLVQSDRVAVVRRNRHQLKLRGERSNENNWGKGRVIEQGDDVQEHTDLEPDEAVQEQIEVGEPETEEVVVQVKKLQLGLEGRSGHQRGERTMTLQGQGRSSVVGL